ncbi:hypothetical protein BS47DRAFT_1408268 [Hydnum rufescens UP504]|uniref:Uncharacterized protein n=1 Tax=Hydnum rufescens UP504 TaxID=1448309 RepID=A0A9P6DUA0_9AGAM|nr:hypothetical protein BS47DRAFT_1408268 [Hydnum rufescens UP504]
MAVHAPIFHPSIVIIGSGGCWWGRVCGASCSPVLLLSVLVCAGAGFVQAYLNHHTSAAVVSSSSVLVGAGAGFVRAYLNHHTPAVAVLAGAGGGFMWEFGLHTRIHAKGIGNLIDIDTYKDELSLKDSLIDISGEEEVATTSLVKNVQTRLVDRKVVCSPCMKLHPKPPQMRPEAKYRHTQPPKTPTPEYLQRPIKYDTTHLLWQVPSSTVKPHLKPAQTRPKMKYRRMQPPRSPAPECPQQPNDKSNMIPHTHSSGCVVLLVLQPYPKSAWTRPKVKYICMQPLKNTAPNTRSVHNDTVPHTCPGGFVVLLGPFFFPLHNPTRTMHKAQDEIQACSHPRPNPEYQQRQPRYSATHPLWWGWGNIRSSSMSYPTQKNAQGTG